jgi:hypothetical protein
MTYLQFIEKTDQLVSALSACALKYQDAKFKYFSAKLDRLYADNPEHRATMVAKRERYSGVDNND